MRRNESLYDNHGYAQLFSKYVFGERILGNWQQWLLFGGFTAMIVAGTIKMGLLFPALLVIMVIGGPILVSILWNTQLGIYLMMIMAFMLSVINRLLPNIPAGIGIDLMILIMVTGMLYRSYKKKDWSSWQSPVSIPLALWGAMNVIELFNPIAASRVAWLFVIRPALGYMMLFFLTYSMLKSKKQVQGLFFFFLAMNFFTALWGIYQFMFGYFDWEMAEIIRKDAVHLVFNHGRWRSFGSIGSPAQFGMLMGFGGSVSFMLLTGYKRWYHFLIFGTMGVLFIVAMLYSGTRSAFIIPGIFYFTWVILSKQKRMYASIAVAVLGLLVLANIETSNYQIQRVQSIFNATEDASYQVRARNRAMIAPWILMHPIGGGLGSTGVWGMRFSPHTFLAHFPPDSGLVRVAVELGWVGLIIFLGVYFTSIIKGFKLYWKMKDPQLKAILASILCAIPAFLMVEWGQEVVGVYPISLLFWMLLAIMFKSGAFDPATKTENQKAS